MNQHSSRSWLLPLALILLAGAGLRIYYSAVSPLFNDELSALSRLQFANFGEVLQKGIKPDGHPAGVQSFLYVWEGLAGNSEFLLRLPFVLCSLASLLLLFSIGKKLFHETAALLMCSFMASIQYGLYFGIQMRPYAMGVFAVLAMFWAGLRIWAQPKEASRALHWLVFVLAASLSTYIHYFAGLQVILLYLMGFVLLRKELLRNYLLAGLAIFLLYLPHIPIFLSQIQKGGIGGWLAAPNLGFFRHYLSYILHFSFIFGLFVLFSWMLGVSQKYPVQSEARKMRRFVALAFLLPMIIGFVYSRSINPVLHEGSAYFAFPFLLLFVASFVPRLQTRWNWFWLIAILLMGMGSLFFQRQIDPLMTQRGNEQIIEDLESWEEKLRPTEGEDLPFLMLQNDPFYQSYYLEQEKDIRGKALAEPGSYPDFHKQLRALESSYLSLSWASKALPLEYVAIAREYYPYTQQLRQYFVSEFYGLSSEASSGAAILPLFAMQWSGREEKEAASYQLRKAVEVAEYSPTLTLDLDSLGEHWHTYQYWASADLHADNAREIGLLLSFEKGDEVLHQEQMPLAAFQAKQGGWTRVHKVVRARQTLFKNKKDKSGIRLKVYVWNPRQLPLHLSSVRLEVWEGNPRLYGLFEPIIGEGELR